MNDGMKTVAPTLTVRRALMRTGTSVALALCLVWLGGCAANHFLVHPSQPAPEVIVWSADFTRDQIQVHLEGARPPGAGPFPAVIVHPEEEETAADMHGIIWELAARGGPASPWSAGRRAATTVSPGAPRRRW